MIVETENGRTENIKRRTFRKRKGKTPLYFSQDGNKRIAERRPLSSPTSSSLLQFVYGFLDRSSTF
jgi:hypothetical protein